MAQQEQQQHNGGSEATLTERVRVLEARVAALNEAFRILIHGLEDIPGAEPGNRAAEAARQAHELLLSDQLPTTGPDGA